MESKKIKLIYLRRLSQITMLFVIGEFSFYGIFRCPFAEPYLSCTHCPVVQCPGRRMFLPFWILLAISTVLFGRAFCGWACPGGLISGILAKVSSIRKRFTQKIEFFFLLFKLNYLTLVVCLFVWLWMANPRWAIPIRIGEFWQSVSLTFQHANNLWLIRTIGVLAFILLGALFGNLWCRYLCPTGGILESLRKIGLFQFRKSDKCNDCHLCKEVCELNTEPENHNCNNCGDCKNVCPPKAIYFGKGGG